jgi:hypothetical protein
MDQRRAFEDAIAPATNLLPGPRRPWKQVAGGDRVLEL